MSKRNRVQRPKEELKRELIEQLQLLRHSCEAFDRGFEAIGKHIALSIRVLVHQHGQSRALLDQLGLRSIRFVDSVGPLNPRNIAAECRLVVMHMNNSGGRYIPLVAANGLPVSPKKVSFVDWWNEPVFKDKAGHTFCRRELVRHVADTDGGGHVDPGLDEAYMAISRANSLGWQFSTGDIFQAFSGRPELVCMRQIAHEILSTIHQFAPEFSAHAQPVVPSP
jgi:hypothetical protein